MPVFKQPRPVAFGAPEEMEAAARDLWATLRDPTCQRCPLHLNSHTVCLFGNGPVPAEAMIVGDQPGMADDNAKRPLQGLGGQYLDAVLKHFWVGRDEVYRTLALKCRASSPQVDSEQKLGQKECATYLEQEILAVQPKVILTMGAPAYFFFTHKAGLMTARGNVIVDKAHGDAKIIPTVSPYAVLRTPKLSELFYADVGKFVRYLRGTVDEPQVDVVEVHDLVDFERVLGELWATPDDLLTFDLETRGFNDYTPGWSKVWCAAFTRGKRGAAGMRSFVIPLEHPDSPFSGADLAYAQTETLRLIAANRVSGHNVTFDIRAARFWANRLGIDLDQLQPRIGATDAVKAA